MDKAGVTVDLAERDTILRRANRLAQDQVAVIPLHYGTDLYGIVKDRGIQFTPRPDRWLVYKDMDKK